MPIIGTPEERARALEIVTREMLVELWTFVLAQMSDPPDEAFGARNRVLEAVEAVFDTPRSTDSTVTRELAVRDMELVWDRIMAAVSDFEGPIDVVPTEYGKRRYDELRRQGRTSPEEPPADETDGAPDR